MVVTENSLVLRQQALIDNPDARLPVCLVLDVSKSMQAIVSGDTQQTGRTQEMDGKVFKVVTGSNLVTRLDELNSGITQFFGELLDFPATKRAAEVCVVAFAGTAEMVKDFEPLSDDHRNIRLSSTTSQDGTSLGHGVATALKLLDQRKENYKSAGVDYYQPWLVVMTDGEPTDDTHYEIANDIRSRVEDKKLSVFPIAIGELLDTRHLSSISPKRDPIKLKGTKFKTFFEWLSKSMAKVSVSVPGEDVPIDTDGLKGWASL